MSIRYLHNFYPRSPCGERPHHAATGERENNISIHVPLAGNVALSWDDIDIGNISIHVPLAGNVLSAICAKIRAHGISIHVPLAGNVWLDSPYNPAHHYFYPRSPCGERRLRRVLGLSCHVISIHVPLAGNVPRNYPSHGTTITFLSTFPLRGTSCGRRCVAVDGEISIHVPLAGNVICLIMSPAERSYFYPRSPCGERLATVMHRYDNQKYFYPRSPCGERLLVPRMALIALIFLSTFPLRGTSNDENDELPL